METSTLITTLQDIRKRLATAAQLGEGLTMKLSGPRPSDKGNPTPQPTRDYVSQLVADISMLTATICNTITEHHQIVGDGDQNQAQASTRAYA